MEKDVWATMKKDGLVVLAVTPDDAKTAKSFIEDHKLSYTVLLDKKGEAAKAFGVRAYPTNIVIAPDGKIALIQVGGDVAAIKKNAEQALASAKKASGNEPEKKSGG